MTGPSRSTSSATARTARTPITISRVLARQRSSKKCRTPAVRASHVLVSQVPADVCGEVTTGGTRPSVGTVVSAGPRTASTVLADQVDDDRVRSIGTRFRGGRMYEATQSGYWAAARIGDAR